MIFEIFAGVAIGYCLRAFIALCERQNIILEGKRLSKEEITERTAAQWVHTHNIVYSPDEHEPLVHHVMPFNGQWLLKDGTRMWAEADNQKFVTIVRV